MHINFIAALYLWLAFFARGGDYSWPERGSDPYPWPRGADRGKILHERFTQASTNSLGTPTDIGAVKQTIAAHRALERVEVRQLRWLSPSLVMGLTRTRSAAYYYIVEKKKDAWSVLTYYM